MQDPPPERFRLVWGASHPRPGLVKGTLPRPASRRLCTQPTIGSTARFDGESGAVFSVLLAEPSGSGRACPEVPEPRAEMTENAVETLEAWEERMLD